MSTRSAVSGSTAGRLPLRNRLITAAREAFVRHGLGRTSMDAVSAYADTSKPILYRHFSSKSELYVAVVEAYLDSVSGKLGEVAAGSDPGMVYRTAGVLFDLVESELHSTPEMVFCSRPIQDRAAQSRLATAQAAFFTVLTSRLGLHNCDPDKAHMIAHGFLGATLAAAAEWHRTRQSMPRSAVLDNITSWYYAGLQVVLDGPPTAKAEACYRGEAAKSSNHSDGTCAVDSRNVPHVEVAQSSVGQ